MRAWDLFRLCSLRCRPAAFEGIMPIMPEAAKGVVFDYDGNFDDYEKILYIDNIFLSIKYEEMEQKRNQEEMERKNKEMQQ
jgi:hypothetical protein